MPIGDVKDNVINASVVAVVKALRQILLDCRFDVEVLRVIVRLTSQLRQRLRHRNCIQKQTFICSFVARCGRHKTKCSTNSCIQAYKNKFKKIKSYRLRKRDSLTVKKKKNVHVSHRKSRSELFTTHS